MLLTIIAAMTENRVLAKDGHMPWHLPADLKHFQRHTLGHACIMGRKTFEAMDGPLPRRTNVVVTRDRSWSAEGAVAAHSLDEAIVLAGSDDQPFIIGGAEIYALALPRAEQMELTLIHATLDGDVFFPDYDDNAWKLASESYREADEKNVYPMTFRTFDRR